MGIYEQCNQCNKYYYLDIITKEDVIRFINNLPWDYIPKEYNTNTSAQPLSKKGEDIVRPILNNEGIELENKESLG